MSQFPRLIFKPDFGEREIYEMPLKGYFQAIIQLENEDVYQIYFSDPIRLSQDLKEDSNAGRPYFAELGLIIIPEVTLENINRALLSLVKEDYFSHLKPVSLDGTPL